VLGSGSEAVPEPQNLENSSISAANLL